ncbi:MAG: enoyl-CoA hydratase-related protein [Thaumarchaeota archaeon]|nr:enoyl-CoA hydratase-related protein [Nitrososphaerota archaeon]
MLEREYENIQVEVEDAVGLVFLDRPRALNALSSALMRELLAALTRFDSDSEIRCIILAGSDRVFSAGADIKEMAAWSSVDALKEGNLERFDAVGKISKPLIAALCGYALGGGLELAMACDIIIAAEGTKLGQPEINIGVFPGAGGTQRLPRTIGKYRAMDLILTGNSISAREALSMGLVSRVVPNELYLSEAKKLAHEIASKAPLATKMAKRCIAKSLESTLSEGLEFEHRNFYLMMSSEDKQEGMKAFAEKRKPKYTGK